MEKTTNFDDMFKAVRMDPKDLGTIFEGECSRFLGELSGIIEQRDANINSLCSIGDVLYKKGDERKEDRTERAKKVQDEYDEKMAELKNCMASPSSQIGKLMQKINVPLSTSDFFKSRIPVGNSDKEKDTFYIWLQTRTIGNIKFEPMLKISFSEASEDWMKVVAYFDGPKGGSGDIIKDALCLTYPDGPFSEESIGDEIYAGLFAHRQKGYSQPYALLHIAAPWMIDPVLLEAERIYTRIGEESLEQLMGIRQNLFFHKRKEIEGIVPDAARNNYTAQLLRAMGRSGGVKYTALEPLNF